MLARRGRGGDEDAGVADLVVDRQMIRRPHTLISRSSAWVSGIQLRACCGRVMLSPRLAKTMLGARMALRSGWRPRGSRAS